MISCFGAPQRHFQMERFLEKMYAFLSGPTLSARAALIADRAQQQQQARSASANAAPSEATTDAPTSFSFPFALIARAAGGLPPPATPPPAGDTELLTSVLTHPRFRSALSAAQPSPSAAFDAARQMFIQQQDPPTTTNNDHNNSGVGGERPAGTRGGNSEGTSSESALCEANNNEDDVDVDVGGLLSPAEPTEEGRLLSNNNNQFTS
jgi:hypothetical protein